MLVQLQSSQIQPQMFLQTIVWSCFNGYPNTLCLAPLWVPTRAAVMLTTTRGNCWCSDWVVWSWTQSPTVIVAKALQQTVSVTSFKHNPQSNRTCQNFTSTTQNNICIKTLFTTRVLITQSIHDFFLIEFTVQNKHTRTSLKQDQAVDHVLKKTTIMDVPVHYYMSCKRKHTPKQLFHKLPIMQVLIHWWSYSWFGSSLTCSSSQSTSLLQYWWLLLLILSNYSRCPIIWTSRGTAK